MRTKTRKFALPAVLLMTAFAIPFVLRHNPQPTASAYHPPHRCTTTLNGCWMPPCDDHIALVGGSCYGPRLRINRDQYWIDSTGQAHLFPRRSQ